MTGMTKYIHDAMFVEIKKSKKCSKCGAVDHCETVMRKHESFIRCLKCGHEKLVWSITSTNLPGGLTNTSNDTRVIYNAASIPLNEEF